MPPKKGVPRPNTGGFDQHPENINRKGRPKVGLTFAERVREVLEAQTKAQGDQLIDLMITDAVKRARHGSFQFWDALMNRAYGKVPDKVEMSAEEKPDLSKLTDEEIQVLTSLLEKAKPK